LRRRQFKEFLDGVQKTIQWFIFIPLLIVLGWDVGSVRCTRLGGYFMPPIPNVSPHIQVCYRRKNWRFISSNVPGIELDTPEDLDAPEKLQTSMLYYR